MPRLALDDVLDSWEADAPPDGFAARVLDLGADRSNAVQEVQAPMARLSAESCLDAWEPAEPPEGFAEQVLNLAAPLAAWEGEQPPDGFAERVLHLAAKRQAARKRQKVVWVSALFGMAAAVAGLILNPLPMPWDHAETLATISARIPRLPSIPAEPAVVTHKGPTPHEAEQAPQNLSPAPMRIRPPSPLQAGRAPSLRDRPNPGPRVASLPHAPDKPAPEEPANAVSNDRKEARFDLSAYKKARASALHREKRFNKTEGSGVILASSYRLAPYFERRVQ